MNLSINHTLANTCPGDAVSPLAGQPYVSICRFSPSQKQLQVALWLTLLVPLVVSLINLLPGISNVSTEIRFQQKQPASPSVVPGATLSWQRWHSIAEGVLSAAITVQSQACG